VSVFISFAVSTCADGHCNRSFVGVFAGHITLTTLASGALNCAFAPLMNTLE